VADTPRLHGERALRAHLARLAARGLAPEPLASGIADAIQRVIPGDGYRFFALDPTTLLVTRLLAASDDDGWARLEWLRDIYLLSEPLSYIEHDRLARWNLPVVAVQPCQEACWGYRPELLAQVSPREHRASYEMLRSPAGGALVAQFATQGRWVAALQLYRRDRRATFTPDDVLLLGRVQAQIGAALGAALLREQAWGAGDSHAGPDAAGVLLLSPDLRVTLCTPAGEAWLARLHDADRAGHEPLPTALWAAVAGVRAGRGAVQVVRAQSPDGPLRVEASPAAPDGTLALVVTPERAPVPPQWPVGWDLTAQERRVVALLLQGLGNREIAAALFVSEHTVEWHLRHAYDKLGVRSRGQLLARFFRETWGAAFGDLADTGQ
jgi:DNA-binding CsgD family transcriptional regulator